MYIVGCTLCCFLGLIQLSSDEGSCKIITMAGQSSDGENLMYLAELKRNPAWVAISTITNAGETELSNECVVDLTPNNPIQ